MADFNLKHNFESGFNRKRHVKPSYDVNEAIKEINIGKAKIMKIEESSKAKELFAALVGSIQNNENYTLPTISIFRNKDVC